MVWNVTVEQYPSLEAVQVPIFTAKPVRVALAVLNSSTQPEEARNFARYLVAHVSQLNEMGYQPLGEGK